MNRLAAAAAALAVLAPAAGMTLTGALVTGAAAAAASSVCGPGGRGPGGPVQTMTGQPLDAEQLANAQTIVTTTARRLPVRAAVIAVATALQESSLRNLPTGDRDSLGLFQQRASWGPAAVRLDPVAATGLFLDALEHVPSWQELPVAVAADQVQHSAYPWAVAKWETAATALATTYWPTGPARSTGELAQVAPGGAGGGAATDCPGQGSDGDSLTGATAAPAGYAPSASGEQAAVVRFALAQLGKPYQWGGTGPDAWDCSGLTMQAWAAAGVALPRTTFQQVLVGAPVISTAALQPGDLIFIAGADGTPTSPGHVGLYLGDVAGVPSLIHAPRTGRNVEIQTLAAWRGQIVAIRRPSTAPRA